MAKKHKKMVLKLPRRGTTLADYQKKGFSALDRVLESGNGAALIAAAKMIFEATGMLKTEPPKTVDTVTVEFGDATKAENIE